MTGFDRLLEWYDAFEKVTWTSKERNKVGSTAHIVGKKIAGVKGKWDAELAEIIENEKGSWRSTGGNFTGFGSTVLSPTKNGTRVTIMIEYELPYSFLGKLIDKLSVHKELEKGFDDGLKKLKEIMEK
jgi:uncharacterized membrane protein